MAAWIILATLATLILSAIYLPLAGLGVVAVVTLLQAWSGMRLHALQTHPEAIVSVRVEADGLWVELAQGSARLTKVLNGGLVTPGLTLLRLRDDGQRYGSRVLVLLPDRLEAVHFRRLRTWLNWRRIELGKSANIRP